MHKSDSMSQDLSKTLSVCNLICTILVISIHFNTKQHINLTDGFTINYYLQEFITNSLARVAVPFFAFTSGFFFFRRFSFTINCYKSLLNKRFSSLFLPFVFGASLILVAELLYGRMIDFGSITTGEALVAIFVKPLSVQFWFVRDLVFLALISPVIYFLLTKLNWILVLVCMACWLLDFEPAPLWAGRSLITIEVGAFFVLGAYLYNKRIWLEKVITTTHLIPLILTSLLLAIWRIYDDPAMSNWYHNNYTLNSLLIQNCYIIVTVFCVLVVSNRLRHKQHLIWLSQFTFFVYLYHLLPLSRVVVKFSDYFVYDPYKFYMTFPVATLFTFIVAIIFSKYSNKLYSILNGGRN
jgi:surface polysaccharide O-acyltransferase-like enzyme